MYDLEDDATSPMGELTPPKPEPEPEPEPEPVADFEHFHAGSFTFAQVKT